MTTAMTAGEKIRMELAARMREAIYNELTREDDRREEEIFDGRGDLHVLLGAIADLAEALIVKAAWSAGGCDWRGMVDEVSGELLDVREVWASGESDLAFEPWVKEGEVT